MKLQYKLVKIVEYDDFDTYQTIMDRCSHKVWSIAPLLRDSYQKTYDTLLPGTADDNTLAGFLSIAMTGMNNLVQVQQVTEQILETTRTAFGHDNVFSFSYDLHEGDLTCYAAFLPIVKHIPNVNIWMNGHKKDTPSNGLIQKIETDIQDLIPTMELSIKQEVLSPEEKGYQSALIKYQMHKALKSDTLPMQYTVTDNTSQIQTIAPMDEVKNIINETITYFTTGPERTSFTMAQNGKMSQDKFRDLLLEHIERYYAKLTDSDISYIMSKLDQWAYGMYILDPLIDDDNISDIMVVRPDDIRVKVKNRRYTSNVKFINEVDYSMFLQGLAGRNHLFLDRSAFHVFSDITTSPKFRMRMNIATPFITSDGMPYFHIRKISKTKRDFKYLLDNMMLDETIMDYLIDRARYGPGMIFTGKGASGKTTLMNCLLDQIPFDKSGLIIQESEELFSDVHPHLMFEHITTNSPNPEMRYELQDLARNGLLTDLDYFIISEVKGAEAKYFINAADTGHRCWCSVHAPSALDAIDKLADYVTYESKYSKTEASFMLKDLGTVIFMKDFQVCEIAELSGWDKERETLKYTPVYLRPGMPHTAFENM